MRDQTDLASCVIFLQCLFFFFSLLTLIFSLSIVGTERDFQEKRKASAARLKHNID